MATATVRYITASASSSWGAAPHHNGTLFVIYLQWVAEISVPTGFFTILRYLYRSITHAAACRAPAYPGTPQPPRPAANPNMQPQSPEAREKVALCAPACARATLRLRARVGLGHGLERVLARR